MASTAVLVTAGTALTATPAAAAETKPMNVLNYASGTCLDAPLDGGNRVVIWHCTGDTNQKWRMVTDNAFYNPVEFKNEATGACLDWPGDNKVATWHCNGSDRQKWYRQSGSNGYVYLVNKASGTCLDWSGGSNVVLWHCNGELRQNWG
ncbi:RICIN domain-containing protein [Streptomyces sp. NPDC048723]|uniref:RICIN domain-containing protein n=1 Tax=Streptomyces sp. NPDC048723 TaxID=3365589 RepID=UPI0037160158